MQGWTDRCSWFIIAALLGVPVAAACPECENGRAFRAELQTAMTTMDRNMVGAPMTGDPDRDFLAMMIPHHQGAIDMAKSVLAHGKDPVAKRLAQEIVATQQAEIELMHRRLDQLPRLPTMNEASDTKADAPAS